MGLTPQQMGEAIARNLPAKTGRTLEDWVQLVKSEGPQSRKERTSWLKAVHGLGHVQAQLIARKADEAEWYTTASQEDLVDAQYAGPRAHLREIYDRLAEEVRSLGDDVRLDARKTYVSLARRRQFGVIQASTNSRVDLGLRLPDATSADRLLPAGSLGNEQISYRLALSSPDQVDEELSRWLRAAYELGA